MISIRLIMPREVVYSREAQKSPDHMDAASNARIREKADLLAHDPDALSNNVMRLKGTEGLWRLRVGDWRVVYSETLVVLRIIRVAPRGGVYD